MSYMPPDPGEPGSAVEQLVRVYDSLQYPGAVKWAKDGRLALFTSSRVDIFEYPGEEQDPYYRWHIPLPKDRHLLECGTLVAQRAYEQRGALVWMMHRISGSETVPPMFAALDWSPLGCAWDGGCLLATLSSDGLLEVWAPPLATRGAQWASTANITALLEAHLLRTEFGPAGVSPELARAAVGKDGLGAVGGSGSRVVAPKRIRAKEVEEDEDREEMAAGAGTGADGASTSMQDATAWATRQDMAAVTAMAWAGERAAAGPQAPALLAAGGPKLVHVWAFLPGPPPQAVVGGEAAAAAKTSAGAERAEGEEEWKEGLLNPSMQSSAFPEQGMAPPAAPTAHCLAPLPTPAALWETASGEVARLAWLPNYSSSSSTGASDGDASLLLAVASAYGNIDLVSVTGRGPSWAAAPLMALSGADYGVVQALAFGTIHLPTAAPAPADTAAEGAGAAPPTTPASLLVAAKGTALHAWTMPEGTPLTAPLEAHGEPVMGIDWARAPDGSEPLLLSAGGDGVVQAWRFEAAAPGEAAAAAAPAAPALALVAEPALTALIPTQREQLMGLAVSPNGLMLAVARAAEGDEGNSRLLQFNRRLRRNHAFLGVQPLFQTGWRSVVLPEDPGGLLVAMGWTDRLQQDQDTAPALHDIPMTAALDFAALLATQVHPDFLTPQGTATTLPDVRRENVLGVLGDGRGALVDGGDGGDGDEDEEVSAALASVKAESVSSSRPPRPKKGKGSRGGPHELRTAVDVSALPEGSHDLLPYTVYHRLAELLLAGAQQSQPPCVTLWQALHALHAHAAAWLLAPAPHLLEAARRVQALARVRITAAYIERSLTELLLRGPAVLSETDRRVAWAMARWLRARRAALAGEVNWDGEAEGGGPPVVRSRSGGEGDDGTWEGLATVGLQLCGLAADGANEATLAAELEERCFLCDSPLDLDPSSTGDDAASCCRHAEAPHRLARCMETRRPIDAAEYWECQLCSATARPHLPGASTGTGDGGAWPFETRPAWLAPFHGGGGVWCLYCHVPCRLVNTAPEAPSG